MPPCVGVDLVKLPSWQVSTVSNVQMHIALGAEDSLCKVADCRITDYYATIWHVSLYCSSAMITEGNRLLGAKWRLSEKWGASSVSTYIYRQSTEKEAPERTRQGAFPHTKRGRPRFPDRSVTSHADHGRGRPRPGPFRRICQDCERNGGAHGLTPHQAVAPRRKRAAVISL